MADPPPEYRCPVCHTIFAPAPAAAGLPACPRCGRQLAPEECRPVRPDQCHGKSRAGTVVVHQRISFVHVRQVPAGPHRR